MILVLVKLKTTSKLQISIGLLLENRTRHKLDNSNACYHPTLCLSHGLDVFLYFKIKFHYKSEPLSCKFIKDLFIKRWRRKKKSERKQQNDNSDPFLLWTRTWNDEISFLFWYFHLTRSFYGYLAFKSAQGNSTMSTEYPWNVLK